MTNPAVIAARNESHIGRSRAVIADLSPFRGPSADAGTVYEIGFARALGLPVFAFARADGLYEARCLAWAGSAVTCDADGYRDGAGMLIESFGLLENLMIVCGIEASGGRIVIGGPDDDEMALFEQAVETAAAWLRQTG